MDNPENSTNKIENEKDSSTTANSNKEDIIKIPPSYKGNSNFEKRNQKQYYHHKYYYPYSNSFANHNTINKNRTNSAKYKTKTGYNHQNYNKNSNNENKNKNNPKKKRNQENNYNNNFSSSNNDKLNFINTYKEAADYSYYNKEFSKLQNLNFLKQNWKSNQYSMLHTQNLMNPFINSNFHNNNIPNLGTNQINLNNLNIPKNQSNKTTNNYMGNNRVMNFPNIINNNFANILALQNLSRHFQQNNNHYPNNENLNNNINTTPLKNNPLNNSNPNMVYPNQAMNTNNSSNQATNNSVNLLVQFNLYLMKCQQTVLNKMITLLLSNNNEINSDIQTTIQQMKTRVQNEMEKILNLLNKNNKIEENAQIENIVKDSDNDKYIQDIFSMFPKQQYKKPYIPLIQLEKNQSSIKTSLHNQSNNFAFNINTINPTCLNNEYYSEQKIDELIKIGKCLTGIIRMNSQTHGYITIQGLKNDILVRGKNLENCLNLDEVVVELFEPKDWKSLANSRNRKSSIANDDEFFQTSRAKYIANLGPIVLVILPLSHP